LFGKVEHWRNKVDKLCIEHIKSFQNPPALIGQIIEIVITLIGRRKLYGGGDTTNTSSTPRGDGASQTGRDDKQSVSTSDNKSKISTIN
jgi:hypothetical protein